MNWHSRTALVMPETLNFRGMSNIECAWLIGEHVYNTGSDTA